MARKKKVRGERVVDAIEESDRPFVTTTDIASHLDVTAQAVRNRADELERYPEITKGNVGQSSVYWLAEEDKPPEVTASTSDDSGSKGILNRWFAGLPSLGDSAEKWYLTTLLLVVGLSAGVAVGIASTHPAMSTAAFTVFTLLVFGLVVMFGWVVHYLFNFRQTGEVDKA